VQPYAS